MNFQLSEQHIHDFYERGVTVLEKIIPPTLISDLRRVTDKGRELARSQRKDKEVQRFQPVNAYEIDQRPFEDYAALSDVREAIHTLLSPQHQWGDLSLLGVLIEP